MDKTVNNVTIIEDPSETNFRKKNQWYSFTGHLYSALGGASFIGLLATVVRKTIDVVVGVEGAGDFFGLGAVAAMGGLMAAGTGFIYLAQKQFTELKMIGDEHMAMQNAKKMLQPGLQLAGTVVHPDNQRADGKSWQEVVSTRDEASQQEQRSV